VALAKTNHGSAVNTAGSPVTTASFTPANGELLVVFGHNKAAATPAKPAITDSLGLSWTEVVDGDEGSRVRTTCYIAVATGSAMTVTSTASGATQSSVHVVGYTGAATTITNFNSGSDSAGDPAVTLGVSPSTGSAVVGSCAFNGGNNVTPPTGFAELYESTQASYRSETASDETSPSGTMTWSTSNTNAAAVVVEVKEASSGATGTAAITEGADTVSAAGTVAIAGAASITEGADTTSAAGTVAVAGTAGITEAGDTSAAAGTVAVAGASAVTEAGDTLAAEGTVGSTAITGEADITEAADTLASAGTVAIAGAAAVTEAADTASAAGTVSVAGAADITEAADTASAAGVVAIAGAADVTEGDDALAATGTVVDAGTILGAADITEADDTLTAEGTAEQPVVEPQPPATGGGGGGGTPIRRGASYQRKAPPTWRKKDEPEVTVVVAEPDGSKTTFTVPKAELQPALPTIAQILDEAVRMPKGKITLRPNDDDEIVQIMRLLAEMDD
jgi:hypothetical protein